MTEQSKAPRRLMPPPAAGQYLGGTATQTLAKWRCQGSGPEHYNINGRIFYDQADLDRYIEERRRRSTSEAA